MSDEHRSQYRLPAELAEQLKQAAEASGRSLNAELVARLQQSFVPEDEARLLALIEEGCRRALAARG